MNTNTTIKRLERTPDDKWLSGVSGGIGRYLGIDSNVVRLLAVVALFVTGGTAFIAYLIAWILMPERRVSTAAWAAATDQPTTSDEH